MPSVTATRGHQHAPPSLEPDPPLPSKYVSLEEMLRSFREVLGRPAPTSTRSSEKEAGVTSSTCQSEGDTEAVFKFAFTEVSETLSRNKKKKLKSKKKKQAALKASNDDENVHEDDSLCDGDDAVNEGAEKAILVSEAVNKTGTEEEQIPASTSKGKTRRKKKKKSSAVLPSQDTDGGEEEEDEEERLLAAAMAEVRLQEKQRREEEEAKYLADCLLEAERNKHLPAQFHFRSPNDPELGEAEARLRKYGQGKNLTAIGPERKKLPPSTHSSPFSFGFL